MSPKHEQIAKLIQLAKIDGDLDHKEILLIYGIAHKHGVQKFQMDEIIRKSDSNTYPRSIDRDENIRFFYQSLILVTVDYKISEEEITFLEKIGKGLSLDPTRVKKAIAHVIENKETDLDETEIVALIQ
ncbi:MAG: hypothetical protein SGI87_00160 [Flavobacteriales bacterium]|nr:hypothetical protein [Flavobacteriales bacterium]